MKAWRALLVWLGVLGVVFTLFTTRNAAAYAGDVGGVGSGGYITSTVGACTGCHFGVTTTGSVTLSGPSGVGFAQTVTAGSVGNIFSVSYPPLANVSQDTGGILIYHNDGTGDGSGLLRSNDAYLQHCPNGTSNTIPDFCNPTSNGNTELMHFIPKPQSGNNITFSFLYDAPPKTLAGFNQCNQYSFTVWINRTNGDLSCFDSVDTPQSFTFTINVVCPEDSNPCTSAVQCSGGLCQYPPAPANTLCRGVNGACDQQEVCDGSHTTCPGDSFKTSGVCRGSTGFCDPAESCNGSSANCPPDVLLNSSTMCRASVGFCDVAEFCTGSSGTCPADSFLGPSTTCRGSSGVCDVAEVCPGNSALCPVDSFQSSAVQCQAPSCTGSTAIPPVNCSGSTPSCPTQAPVDCSPFTCSGNSCANGCVDDTSCNPGNYCSGGKCKAQGNPGDACSATDQCLSGICVDGVCCKTTCGNDPNDCEACNLPSSPGTCTPLPKTSVCRGSAGVCDPAETCDGVNAACPADAKSPRNTVCRKAVGGCDIAEVCDGSSNTCPSDVLMAAGVTCRNSAGACDLAETCDGSSGQCPADKFLASTTLCRGAAGVCDAAEYCTGSAALCPPDGLQGTNVNCRVASCTNGTATLGANCTGSAVGCPALKTQICDPYVCGPTACFGNCTADAQCATTDYCSAGVCVAKLSAGAQCSQGDQCLNGDCVDGYCCNTSCNGQCEACNVKGKEGTCSPVTGTPVGQRVKCSSDNSLCGGQCDGTTRSTCIYSGVGTSCRDASCANGIATVSAFCDGRGSCPPAFTQDCGGQCDGKACGTDCTVDKDCGLSSFCSAGVCVAKQGAGAKCPNGNACVSGACVDGYCCNSSCGTQCEACDVPGKEGVCSPVTGAPHGARTACASDGTSCNGTCNGTNKDGCAYPDKETLCRAATCASNVATIATYCSGDGRCPVPQEQSCLPGSCSGTICGAGTNSCTTDAQCGAGKWCQGGRCTATLAVGERCSADTQCALKFCVDGFCCSRACTGQCEACDLQGDQGQPGSCNTVYNELPHGGRSACAGSGSCGGLCLGDPNVCGFPTSQHACGTATCADGIQTDAPVCDGQGSCLPAGTTPCKPYLCGTNGCGQACGETTDCAPGFVCNSGSQCVPGGAGTSDAGEAGAAGATNTPDGGVSDASTDASSDASTDASMDGGGTTSVSDAGTGSKSSKDSGGCGCRVAGAQGSARDTGAWLSMLAVGALVFTRRRRAAKRAVAAR
jgi:MYXO-CTERM domain-containing protein